MANENYYPEKVTDATALDPVQNLKSREVELEGLKELMTEQKATSIPALFAFFYKFIANPSSVSVETFKRMIDTDDTVGSGVDFLVMCLASRMGAYVHPDEKVTKFVNDSLAKISGGWQAALKKALSATWAGFSVGEMVWKNDSEGFLVDKIVPLPPTTILFEVEDGGELTPDGILQYQRNWNPMAYSQGLGFFGGLLYGGNGFNQMGRPDPFARAGDLPFPMRTANQFQYLSVRIPKAKCLHISFDAQGNFGNPYGRSLLRRCYKYYVIKDALLRMMSTALDRKGTPLTVVFTDPNTTVIDETKAQAAGRVRDRYVGQKADQAAREAFKNVHNDSVIFLPGKKGQIFDIESIQQGASTADFIAALNYCDKAFLRSLLIPALIFSSGDGTGSYALGETHDRVFDKVCDSHLSGICPSLLDQLVRPLIEYNFGKKAIEKDGLGEFGQRELTSEERQKEMEVLSTLNDLGGLDMQDLDDLNEARSRANLPPRTKVIPVMNEFGEEGEAGFGEEGEGDDGKQNKKDPKDKPKEKKESEK